MAKEKIETASFMLRFTQKIFKDDSGENQVQWRGNVRHVQGGDEKRFSDIDDAMQFMQSKLEELTKTAVQDESSEDQQGILAKSFSLWKRVATDGTKLVLDTVKDPKKQVTNIQHSIQDSFNQVRENIGDRLDFDSWARASKEDYSRIMNSLGKLEKQMEELNSKLNHLSKK